MRSYQLSAFSSQLVLLCGLAPACLGGRSAKEERPILATVAGVPIHLDDFKREAARLEPESDEGLPAVTARQAQRRALLDDIIDRRLLLMEAEQHNVVVGMDDVEAVYQRTHHGWTEEDFTAVLDDKDLTPAELKRELREMMLIRKYLRDHVFARVAVTDQEIESYLQAHPEMHIVAEQVRALQIVVKTEEQAKQIAEEIKRGMTFEDAAIKYSLSPEAKSGGDLGFFARGVMPAVFDQVCFSLVPGAVSKVVASDYGYHLFKVIERRPEAERPVEEVRDAAETILRRDKEAAAQRAKIDELRKSADIQIREEILAQAH